MSGAGARLAALRLSALGIAAADAATPVDAVRGLLALQAQDFASALWSIGVRVPGSTAASTEAAHAAGGIVRSWPMRGTLHLVAAEAWGGCWGSPDSGWCGPPRVGVDSSAWRPTTSCAPK